MGASLFDSARVLRQSPVLASPAEAINRPDDRAADFRPLVAVLGWFWAEGAKLRRELAPALGIVSSHWLHGSGGMYSVASEAKASDAGTSVLKETQ